MKLSWDALTVADKFGQRGALLGHPIGVVVPARPVISRRMTPFKKPVTIVDAWFHLLKRTCEV